MKRCKGCSATLRESDPDLCERCDFAEAESLQRAEQAFELGADYGRVMGWYDEPSDWEER